jgi:vacuolar-type H+-ATPase subunit I/STV1
MVDSLIFCLILFGTIFCLISTRKVSPEWTAFLCLSLLGTVAFYSLTEVNFGTLSRHRMVLIPFVFAAYVSAVFLRANVRFVPSPLQFRLGFVEGYRGTDGCH